MSDFLPVPVAAAKAIAERYQKTIVLILAWDPVHGKTNVTTYGENEADRLNAAAFGERVAKEAGLDSAATKRSEDFRTEVLLDRFNGDFRDALRDPERIAAAGAMLAVSRNKGDSAEYSIAMMIADFVNTLIGESPAGSSSRRLVTFAEPPLFDFASFEDWCSAAQRRFAQNHVTCADTLCIDTKGRICEVGLHFSIARDENAYPIHVYRMRNEVPV